MNFKSSERRTRQIFFAVLLALAACAPNAGTATKQAELVEPTKNPPAVTQTPAPTINFNPLTGLPVEDPSLLELPALLVSISHFPPTARPQAGLSFAPFVFEIYITEGATRFLTTFYGEFPAPESPLTGGCETRTELFHQSDLILGNRAWLDANRNGVQEAWENGVSGLCVNLYDANLNLLQQTTTDSNGYFGFNVSAGTYRIAAANPPQLEFAQKDTGDETQDSDMDSNSGWSDALNITSSNLDVDIGLIPSSEISSPSAFPEAKVGPVRSGRLVYADIAGFFADSCLIYAFASPEVLAQLPQCAFVTHDIQGGGYMLAIDEMKQLAQDRKPSDSRIDYESNVFSAKPPEGGANASLLNVYIAYLNQSAWRYDPLSGSYWRFVDDAVTESAGLLHPEVDRLTSRQLQFENVIILFTKHDVVSPTNLDIHLDENLKGKAILFRNGRKYDIGWSTQLTDEEIRTGRRKPIRLVHHDGETLFPLKPGHTWIIVVTPETTVSEKSPGEWQLQFSQPPGAK